MKDFYFWRYEATGDFKNKVKNSGIAVLEGQILRDKLGNIVREEKYKVRGEHKEVIKNKRINEITKNYTYQIDVHYEYKDKEKYVIVLEPSQYKIFEDNVSEIINNEIIPHAFDTGKKSLNLKDGTLKFMALSTLQKKKEKELLRGFLTGFDE